MTQQPYDNAEPPAVMDGGDPAHPVTHPRHATDAGSAPSLRSGPSTPAINRRLGQELDHRLRSLRVAPAEDVPAPPTRTNRGQPHRHRALLKAAAVFIVAAGLAVLLLQAFVIQPFSVPGTAMTPTLQSGDRILVLKSGLLSGSIERGDIIVFHLPRSPACSVVGGVTGDLVLRVVALPGEVISSAGDAILVDGRPLREGGWYDHRFGQVGSTPIRSTTLGAGRYFVLADNRADACDSRAFGPIAKSSVVGQGVAVVGRNGRVSLGTL